MIYKTRLWMLFAFTFSLSAVTLAANSPKCIVMEKHSGFESSDKVVRLVKTYNIRAKDETNLSPCLRDSQFDANYSCQADEFTQHYSRENEIKIVINVYNPNTEKLQAQSIMVGSCFKSDETNFVNGNFVNRLKFSPKSSFTYVRVGMGGGCGTYLLPSIDQCNTRCEEHFRTVCKPQGFSNWTCISKDGLSECAYSTMQNGKENTPPAASVK